MIRSSRNFLLFFSMLCLAAGWARAEDVRLIRSQYALNVPDPLSSSTGFLQAGLVVDAKERRGGWVRVRSEKVEGWVRIQALARVAGDTSAWSTILDFFRRSTGVADAREVMGRPSAHALILTIGDYGNGVPGLPGVRHDADSAVLMARALGVPEEQTITLADSALSLYGMRSALDGLDAQVLPNDEVFLYFSGRGTRVQLDDGRCTEALLARDAQAMASDELERRLARIAARARRLVVFVDASFSGGVALKGALTDGLTAKYWVSGGSDPCQRPDNQLRLNLLNSEPGSGRNNYVYVSAASSDEAALDDQKRGGLATLAWLDCLAGSAKDLDRSAGLSADEITQCAQPLLRAMLEGNPVYPSYHLALAGNAGMVLEPVPPAETDPAAVLADIHANRDDHRRVRLVADRQQDSTGAGSLHVVLDSSEAGYVYLLRASLFGPSFDLLFPNRADDNNRIAAGARLVLPRSGWELPAGGLSGRDTLLAIVSDTPRDFSRLDMHANGLFSSIVATPMSARDIRSAATVSTHASRLQCTQIGKRTAQAASECSDAYGAALTRIEAADSKRP